MNLQKIYIQRKIKIIAVFAIFTIINLRSVSSVNAQSALSFSVSPPITEITIQPGKEIKQTYVLQNNGGDIILKPRIVYFVPSDEFGNVELTQNSAPSWVKYDSEPFNLKFEGQKTFNVIFNVPSDESEVDHYLTLVFESDKAVDLIGQTSSFYKTEIGSNIIVSVSKDGNPKKSAEIVKFSGNRFVDSLFGKIEYDVVIKNNGNSYWKPNGKISINNNNSIKIAPLNILSGKQRIISCIENEELKKCIFDKKYLFGKVVSTLEFRIDENSNIYRQSITTIAFPFSLIIILLILLTLTRFKGIFNIWRKR